MRTPEPTNTFCPRLVLAPIEAPAMTWQKCQIFVPEPMRAGSSMTAVGCAYQSLVSVM